MALVWSALFELGHPKIDAQHRELFRRTNDLLDALLAGAGAGEAGRMLDFLAEYVVEHFREEEELMRRQGYPEYPAHKEQHDRFVARLEALQTGAGRAIDPVLVNRLVCDWLTNHILGSDQELALALLRRPPQVALT